MADPKLRIAQLANFVGPVSGGMKVAIEELGKGYVAAGHERIMVIPGERDTVTDTENGIVVQVKAPRISKQYRMIAKPWRALDVLERFNPTSIEVSDKWTLSPAGNWASRRNIGSALFSHERLDDMLSMWLKRQFGVETAVGALNRRLAKQFDAVVVTSHYAADEFMDTGATLWHVPLGVDLETFHPMGYQTPEPGPDGTRERPVQICYVGRMSHEKSPQLGVGAAVELHRRGVPIELHMYGTGPDVDALKEQAGDAPVIFHGFVDGRAEVAKRFAHSDISYSVCPAETFGLAVLEALACGTPVVTSNRGGAHELVDATSGEFGAPTAESLADATERLIARLGPDLRTAARARAEQYTWQASTEKMLALHTRLAQPEHHFEGDPR
ncbi:glycosyltransferase [Aestuariimicrobium sp. Y1814]|uniref:glycosyltransferase n=1 Tax=Aestuariimicrobium sp. Y1814 TaxID=3418742 RepID=UPI003DA7A52F